VGGEQATTTTKFGTEETEKTDAEQETTTKSAEAETDTEEETMKATAEKEYTEKVTTRPDPDSMATDPKPEELSDCSSIISKVNCASSIYQLINQFLTRESKALTTTALCFLLFVRLQLCKNKSFSPWFFDPRARLLARTRSCPSFQRVLAIRVSLQCPGSRRERPCSRMLRGALCGRRINLMRKSREME